MSNVLVDDGSLKNIADAIRGKLSECGSDLASAKMTPTTETDGKLNMASMIKKIMVGGVGCTHTDVNGRQYMPNDSGEAANDENVLVQSSSLQRICNAIYAKLPGSPSEVTNEASTYGMRPTVAGEPYSMEYFIGQIQTASGGTSANRDIRKWPMRYLLGGDGMSANLSQSDVAAMLLECSLDGSYRESDTSEYIKEWDENGYSYVEAWGTVTSAWRWSNGTSSDGRWIAAGGTENGGTMHVFPSKVIIQDERPAVGFGSATGLPLYSVLGARDATVIDAGIIDMVSTRPGSIDILVRLKRAKGDGYAHGHPYFWIIASGIFVDGDLTWD